MNRTPGLIEAIEPSIEAGRHTLDLALLRTFTAIVEAGSMARAAEQVARSQPAVSLQMKKLEDMIGSAVLRKNGRRLVLTEVGETLFAYAKRLLELNDEAVAAVSSVGLAGAVRLGIAQDFAEGCLTSVLARFARAHPAVVVEVCADRNAVLQERLARRQLDIVLTFGEESSGHLQVLGKAPVAWIGLPDAQMDADRRIALVAFEAPCYFRQVAIQTL
ncbi:MAG: LysR family transcriptional regulator, partial [Bacteroidales bacterium]|nr:LysR family transcriptional regulator [Bacteroidales bacterium]